MSVITEMFSSAAHFAPAVLPGGYMRTALVVSVFLLTGFLSIVGLGQLAAAPYTPRLQIFAAGLSRPILLRSAKDGSKRIFVVQQDGAIKVFQPGASTSTTFIDLTSKIFAPTPNADERGLLGLTFHP